MFQTARAASPFGRQLQSATVCDSKRRPVKAAFVFTWVDAVSRFLR
jgi:hypothetical protein